jgi:hypothetical protein
MFLPPFILDFPARNFFESPEALEREPEAMRRDPARRDPRGIDLAHDPRVTGFAKRLHDGMAVGDAINLFRAFGTD